MAFGVNQYVTKSDQLLEETPSGRLAKFCSGVFTGSKCFFFNVYLCCFHGLSMRFKSDVFTSSPLGITKCFFKEKELNVSCNGLKM